MTGGRAYVLDSEAKFERRVNLELVQLLKLDANEDIGNIRTLLERHFVATKSSYALDILTNWDDYQEHFWVVLLDARHRVLGTELVSQGTLTASLVHPREEFRPALRAAAAALVLVHNHPSGDPTPSREDREVTTRLARAGEILGVPVVDHVVVAEQGFCSLREEGALPLVPVPAEPKG